MSYILLLEPNTLLARTYTQALTLAGHTVRPVVDAQAAIHAADERRPDVVVLDLQLPLHNGIEFLHEFRSYPEWREVPAVVVTMLKPSRLQAGEQALRDELGIAAVLYKPTATLADICCVVGEQAAAL